GPARWLTIDVLLRSAQDRFQRSNYPASLLCRTLLESGQMSAQRTKSQEDGGSDAVGQRKRGAYARWPRYADGRPDAAVLDPSMLVLGAGGRRCADAAVAAGRTADRVPRQYGTHRHNGASLSSPLCIAVLRAQRGERPALRLSRLEIRRG